MDECDEDSPSSSGGGWDEARGEVDSSIWAGSVSVMENDPRRCYYDEQRKFRSRNVVA